MEEEKIINKIEIIVPTCDGQLKLIQETSNLTSIQEVFKTITQQLGFQTEFTPLKRKGGD